MISDIDSKLRTIIAGMVGETVIFANQDATQPGKPFWTFFRQTQATLGLTDYGDVDDNGIQDIRQTNQTTVNIQRFSDKRGSSLEAMEQFKFDLKKPSVRDLFTAQKINVYDTGDVQDVTGLLDGNKYEDRASLDIFLAYRSTDTDDVGLIETVEIDADYENDEDATIETIIVDLT